MTGHNLEKERIRKMQVRIEYLENLSRGYLFSSDLLVSLGEFNQNAALKRDPEQIFQFTHHQLKRLLDFPVLAFFMVDEDSSDFVLTNFEPKATENQLQQEVDGLIESGTFAWALNQNRPVVVKSTQYKENLILHVLATQARVRGMFLGVVEKKKSLINDTILQSLSIVLQNTANALESAALYQIMYDNNQKLEKELEQANQVKTQLITDLASAIRHQVNAIKNDSDALKKEIQESGKSNLMENLAQIESAGEKLLGLIDTIADP